jgi:hypothetical protein
MSDQTVKHDNSLPGFLLILLPAAFAAVFLSIAWPFILGGVVFLTGNSVWQSYQWAKLSQQVNPYFSQMVLEQQGEIAPLALSARANISAPVADRYLQGKAAEIGGVSYRSDAGGTVYSFLTVNSLKNTFAGLSSNESISQKLAELDYVVVDAEPAAISKTLEKSAPVLEQPISTPIAVVPEIIAKVIDSPAVPEQPAPTVVAAAPVASMTPTEMVSKVVPAPVVTPVVIESVTPTASVVAKATPVIPAEPVVAKVVPSAPVTETLTEPVVAKVVSAAVAVTPVESVVVAKVEVERKAPIMPAKIAEENTPSGSSFAQALRGIFDAGNEPVVEETIELEEISSVAETITQADLAKRLDVHPSTLYKRRSDVSFGDWTRNRDPEGFGWGYQRDTKEFYRLA